MFRIAAVVGGTGVLSGFLLSHFRVHASSKKEHDNGATKLWDFNWDHMEYSKATDVRAPENESPSVVKPSATRTLILIRHGQYEHQQNDSDKRILTKLGREQAQLTGERLRELGEKYTIMYYSSMPRATETAEIISKCLLDVPTRRCDMLQEGAPVRPEPPHSTWKPEKYEFYRDGARIEAAFRKYFHRAPPTQEKNSTEVIVCHANVIRYFVCRCLQLPPEAWLRMSLAHASITRVVIRPNGKVHLRELGNSGHLPPDKITFG